MNVLLSDPEAIAGRTVPEMVSSAWADKPELRVAAIVSLPPFDRMAEDIREWFLEMGWYWVDTKDGRRWYPPEHDLRSCE